MARLQFAAGDEFELAGPVKINGAIQDMTGWTVDCAMRGALVDLTPKEGAPIDVLVGGWADPANAIVSISRAHAATAAWPVGSVVLDIRLTSPDGKPMTSQRFGFDVISRVTP